MKSIPEILAEELGQKLEYVQNVVNLMDEGNTIPFIARYRKEMHGAMETRRCGIWRPAWPTCAIFRSAGTR